jgi:peptidoglycan L-alanyl-D-glutamate endopeptidase CwlK
MISSRSTFDLLPGPAKAVKQLIADCDKAGIHLIITCSYRDREAQAELYARGRYGDVVIAQKLVVTNAKPGRSWHQFRRAVDVVPLRYGKPVWGTDGDDLRLWLKIGQIGEAAGLEWAGRWKSFREFPHFQMTDGLSLP